MKQAVEVKQAVVLSLLGVLWAGLRGAQRPPLLPVEPLADGADARVVEHHVTLPEDLALLHN